MEWAWKKSFLSDSLFFDFCIVNLWNLLNKISGEPLEKGPWYLANMIWATTRQNVSSGVSDQARHKPACAATEASWSLEISAIESKVIILSKQRTTKALNRLCGCTGWSAPLLFANDKRHIFPWPGSIIYYVQCVDDLNNLWQNSINIWLSYLLFPTGILYTEATLWAKYL